MIAVARNQNNIFSAAPSSNQRNLPAARLPLPKLFGHNGKRQTHPCSSEMHDTAPTEKVTPTPLTPKKIVAIMKPLKPFRLLVGLGRRNRGKSSANSPDVFDPSNPMHFLESGCPEDVARSILAFAGPQTLDSLQSVSKTWKSVIDEEETWRVMCESLYKWKPGDEVPLSWKEYYRLNPCVPVDYGSIHRAIDMASGRFPYRKHPSNNARQHRNIRVLVRPGEYDMKKQVNIRTAKRSLEITIEKMQMPPKSVFPESCDLSCDYSFDDTSCEDEYFGDDVILTSSSLITRRDEPFFRVSRGNLRLKNLRLHHHCRGIDLWSGNAAIHVESADEDVESNNAQETVSRRKLPSVVLEHCEISSTSGRGVVVVNGNGSLKDCHVHSCASTGIYVAGKSACLSLDRTDLTANGLGNIRNGGVARGHSGIFMDEAHVDIVRSSISQNAAAGITVAPSESMGSLSLRRSDVLGNVGMPVELPLEGNAQAGVFLNEILHRENKNRISKEGNVHPRSSIYEDPIGLELVGTHVEFEEYIFVDTYHPVLVHGH